MNYNTAHANDEQFKIIFPRLLQPVIKLQSGSFTITIRAAEDASDWEAKIYTQYKVTSLVLENADYEQDNELWSLEVSIPDETAEDLYNLEIKFTVNDVIQTLTEDNAVQVLEEYRESFLIIHMSDSHIVPGATSGIEKFKQAILQTNLFHPAFVIFTGDLVESGSESSYKYLEEICKNFQIPVYALAGNHDVSSGTTNYYEYISELYYSFEYGEVLFIMALTGNASLGSTQIAWIENELTEYQSSSLKAIAFHYPVWYHASPDYYLEEAEQLIDICNQKGVDLVLYGHLHNDDFRIIESTKYIMTTSVSGLVWAGNLNGYRIISIEDYEVTDYSYDDEILSQPLPGINVERIPANIRDLEKGLKLKITNELSHPLENLRVKAVLKPLINDEYFIFNATPISTVNSSNGWLIIAECTVPTDSSVEIAIYPSNPSAPNIVDISYPSQVEDSKSFTVEATIENEVSGVESVDLFYFIDDLEQLNRESVDYSDTDSYSIRVPSQPSGTKSLRFYIVARDFSGLEATSETYTVIIGSEEEPIAGIPGFPIEGIILGVVLAVIAITMIRKKEEILPF